MTMTNINSYICPKCSKILIIRDGYIIKAIGCIMCCPFCDSRFKVEIDKLILIDNDHPSLEREDLVNHPPHYTSHPSGTECIEVVEHFNFCIGNAIKYLWRAGLKGDRLEDLKKARWYVDREIARVEKEQE